MNLIDKFENAPFQDVGTFNAIFPWTPLVGFNTAAEVKIGKIVTESERIVFVNEVELRLSLIEPKNKSLRKHVPLSPIKAKQKREKAKARIKRILPIKFSSPFRELTFGEFFVYKAIMEIKEVKTLEVFSHSLGIDTKTMSLHMKNLIKKRYVEKTTVYKGISRD